MTALLPMHGGPDAHGVPLHDFSTNSNACGPCPQALAAVQQADAAHYPDPGYTDLRAHVADFCGVDRARIVFAGSASEFIFRITAWARQQGACTVSLPVHAYGDYAHAANAWGLQVADSAYAADLVWACEPSSPKGQSHQPWPLWLVGGDTAVANHRQVLVLDCAYAPLRLLGASSLIDAQRQQLWQLFSPNKALGLTGVRAAFAIAPVGVEEAVAQLNALAPSWVLGAHGVAMLQAWVQPDVQAWLTDSLHTLRLWKAKQIDILTALGWTCLPSDANFFCARPPMGLVGDTDLVAWDAALVRLRQNGIKLRDTASFGLPGHARLGVLSPAAQEELRLALMQINPPAPAPGKMAVSTP